jgi:hypothetical protein
MAFTAEVKAKLGLDTTEFQRGLTKATAQVGEAGKDISRKINRAFGAGDVFKGLLQGLGIASVEKVVDKLTEGYRKAAEEAEKLAESTAKTLGIYEQLFKSRRDDAQNLEANLRQQAKLQKELEGTKEQRGMVKRLRGGSMFNQPQEVQVEGVTREADPMRAAKIAEELAALSTEETALKDKLKKQKEKDTEEQFQTDVLNISEIAALDSANAKKSMTTREQIADAEQRYAEMATLASETDLSTQREIRKIVGEIADLKKKEQDEQKRADQKRIDDAKKITGAEKTLAEAKKANRDAFAERSTISLQEAAEGKYGTPQSRKVIARRALMLEERAKRQRAQGFDTSAADSTSRSLSLRSQLGFVSESDRDPMKNSREHIQKSMEYLEEIRNSLQPGNSDD